MFRPKKQKNNSGDKTPDSPTVREVKQLKEQLDQQALQTRQALAQLMLVREQLISETNARIEAQVSVLQKYVFENFYALFIYVFFSSAHRHRLNCVICGSRPSKLFVVMMKVSRRVSAV